MKRNSHFLLVFFVNILFFIPKLDLYAEGLLFSWLFSDCYVHAIGSKPYFEDAYRKYPTIPVGMLEAVSFSYTRFESRVWQDTVLTENDDIPATYSVMGLTLNGKGYFRENLRMVASLSGIKVEDIVQDDRTAVMAYASAFAVLQKKYGCYGNHVEDYKQIFMDLSEIPLQCEFALNSSLYSIYLFLSDSDVVQYGIPRREIDFRQLFGDWLPSLQQKNVILVDSTDNKHVNADYPNALWVPASSCNYSSRNGTQVTNLTIHYTSGTYAGAIAWFQNCNARVSAHYVIRSIDGQVTQMVREADKAWHVGVANGYTIGIEHEAYGNIAAFFTPVMYASSAALVRDICSRYPNINPLHTFYRDTLDDGTVLNAGLHALGGSTACTQIRGHQHFPDQTHTDPGPYWDWNYYYKLINSSSQIDSTSDIVGIFADSGGQYGDYGNNERRLFLIHVPNADSIALDFSEFDLEPDYDFLWIYEGNTIFSNMLGRWNTQSPGRVVAHGENILVEFRSDCSTVASGWLAHWTGYCSAQMDMSPPITRILADEQSWKSRDFQVVFRDSDDVAVQYRFFQIMEQDRDVWSANPRSGFFCDNFDSTLSYTGWQHDGNWTIQNHALRQSNMQDTHSWIMTPLNGSLHAAYLYDFYMAMDSDVGDCSFIFHSDKSSPDHSARYLAVTFSKGDNSMVVREHVNGQIVELQRVNRVYYTPHQEALYRVVWDTVARKIMVFRHASLLTEFSLPVSVNWSGQYMGFMTDSASVTIDNMRVYGARGDTALVTVGASINKMVRQQAKDGVPTCKIKSIVMDNAAKYSTLEEKLLKVDYTAPLPVRGVQVNFKYFLQNSSGDLIEGYLQALWGTARDMQSEVYDYRYIVVVENAGNTLNMIWDNNGLSTSCWKHLRLATGSRVKVGVLAVDAAGLQSSLTYSTPIVVR